MKRWMYLILTGVIFFMNACTAKVTTAPVPVRVKTVRIYKVWVPGHYTVYGRWVPGHWRYER